jgi:hypothetical protein
MIRRAWARIGYDHAYSIAFWDAFGPVLGRLFLLVPAVVGLAVLWAKVPHVYLGAGALVAAAVVGLAWMLWAGSHRSLQRRMMDRATGTPSRRGAGLGFALGGVVVLLLGVGWLALWSPYA